MQARGRTAHGAAGMPQRGAGMHEGRGGVRAAALSGGVVGRCRCPLKHPYFRERLRETLRVGVQLPEPAPLEQRKVVLYFSRNHGRTKAERRVSGAVAQAAAADWLAAQAGHCIPPVRTPARVEGGLRRAPCPGRACPFCR